jgi:hypothetical protein
MMFDLPQPLAGQKEIGGFREGLEAGELDRIETHGWSGLGCQGIDL